MASIIPRANIPQSNIGALPRPQIQAPDVSSQNQVLETAAKGVAEYGQQWQERNDTAALLQARRELSDFEANEFNPDNAQGISQYQGGNALGAGAIVGKADARISEIRGRLTPRQQQQFDAISGNFRDSLQGRLNSHMDREHSAYLQAETKASLENLSNDAVSAGLEGDFARQDQIGNELIAANMRALQVQGAGPETLKAASRGVASNVYSQTALGLAASNPFAAQDYYERNADKMEPADQLRVESVLRPVVEDAEDDATADAIIAGRDVTGGAETDAQIEGVDAQINQLEGTGQNPRSSARGVGQFLDSTWLEVVKKHRPDLTQGKSNAEILTLRDDPTLARELLTKFRQDNARSLTARGITANPENLYAAHHFGIGGATKFARADNATPMTQVLPRKAIAANPYLADKTVGEVKANWAQRGLQVAGVSSGASPEGIPRTEAEAIDYARGQIDDPRRRKQVVAKIKEKWQIRDAEEKEREKAASEAAYTAISDNTDPRKPLRDIIGPQAYAVAAKKGQLDSLESYRKNILSQTLVQSNPVLVDALNREAVLSPNTFMKRNLYDSAGELSADDLKALTKMQEDASKPEKRTEWATTNQRVASGWRVLDLDPTKDTKSNRDARQGQRAAFSVAYRNAEKDFVQRNKRQPTSAEADVLLRSVTRAAASSLAEGHLTLQKYGAIEGFGAALSDQTRAEIAADFRESRGREPTEAELVNIAALARQRGM